MLLVEYVFYYLVLIKNVNNSFTDVIHEFIFLPLLLILSNYALICTIFCFQVFFYALRVSNRISVVEKTHQNLQTITFENLKKNSPKLKKEIFI